MSSGSTATIPLPLLKGEVAARSADGEVFSLRLHKGAEIFGCTLFPLNGSYGQIITEDTQ